MDNAFYKFEHDFWDVTAKPYDSGFSHVTSQSIKYLFEEIQPKAGSNILDVACGPGYVTKEWESVGVEVIGVDFSNAMVALAQERHPKSTFKVADAENLPFEDQSFEGVSCNFGILHFPNPEKAMSEAYRVLKKGKKYSFAIWNVIDKSPAMSSIMKAVEKHATAQIDLPDGPPFFHYANQKNCVLTLEKIGFGQINFKEVSAIWKIRSAKDFVEYFRDGGARIGANLRSQSAESLDNIINEIEKNIAQYYMDDGYLVPVSIVIVSARR